jgi:hypothetical protein
MGEKTTCPVCKQQVGLVRGRIARHKVLWPQPHFTGRRVPCHGSGRKPLNDGDTNEQQG